MSSHRMIAGALAVAALLVAGCTAETNPATNVTSTSATLNASATLGSNDQGGDFWFEYSRDGGNTWTQGPRHPWGSQSCTYNGSGTEGKPIAIHDDVTGLTPASHYLFRLAGRICNTSVAYADSNWRRSGDSDPPYEYDSFDTPVPNHVETWAYDDNWPQGADAPASLVAHWVNYAEAFRDSGDSKAVSDCHSAGASCKTLVYFDAYRIYSCEGCSLPISSPPDPESWWLHEPGFSDAQHRLVIGDNGNRGNLTNPSVPELRNWLRDWARAHYDGYDGLMIDDSPASLHLALYPSGFETSNELTSDAQVDAMNTQVAAAMTHGDGSPFLQVDNGITPNQYLPPGFGRLDNAGTRGLLTEGIPMSDGTFTAYYENLLDEMAYLNTKTNGFMVVLGEDDAGSLQARRDQAATVLLGYSPGHEVSWSNMDHDSADLSIWPEEGIYPTQPVQSMPTPGGPGCLSGDGSSCATGGHNALQVAPGVFRREFANCFNRGVAFGRCAVIVNWNDAPVTTQASWLTSTYGHKLTMSGGDVQSGGTINVSGASYQAGASLPGHDSLILSP